MWPRHKSNGRAVKARAQQRLPCVEQLIYNSGNTSGGPAASAGDGKSSKLEQKRKGWFHFTVNIIVSNNFINIRQAAARWFGISGLMGLLKVWWDSSKPFRALASGTQHFNENYASFYHWRCKAHFGELQRVKIMIDFCTVSRGARTRIKWTEQRQIPELPAGRPLIVPYFWTVKFDVPHKPAAH